MPVEHVLPVFAVIIPVYLAPKLVDAGGQGLLLLGAVNIILVYAQQGLHQEGSLHQVATIVFLPERFHLARVAIPPVRIYAVEAVGTFQEGNNALHAGQALGTRHIATVYAGQHGHDAEAAAAAGHYVLVVLGVDAIHVDAFAGQAAVGLGAVPEVVEGAALDGVEQCLIADGLRLVFRLGRLALREGRQQEQ